MLAATRPAGPGQRTAPASAKPTKPTSGRRRFVIVASAGAAAGFILGAVGLAALVNRDDGDAIAPQALPATSPAVTATIETPEPSAVQSASRIARPTATRRPGDAVGPTRTATSRPARPPGGPASTAPPTDRTGVIGTPGGRCLNLNGGVAVDGNFVDVRDCDGSGAQNWTFGVDGTLRVAGKCAQSIEGDNVIHINGCDGRAAARWRAGPNSSLVNAVTGRCLSDPANGRDNGTAVRLTRCSGDASQRFDLP